MKEREFLILQEISQNEKVTQAKLASSLGIAIGSVNWYIKRLINRGYLKATKMDRTRLKYNLTPQGMKIFTKRASQYMKDSLLVYKDLRLMAKEIVKSLKDQQLTSIYVGDSNKQSEIDILYLSCLEAGIIIDDVNAKFRLEFNKNKYVIRENDN